MQKIMHASRVLDCAPTLSIHPSIYTSMEVVAELRRVMKYREEELRKHAKDAPLLHDPQILGVI